MSLHLQPPLFDHPIAVAVNSGRHRGPRIRAAGAALHMQSAWPVRLGERPAYGEPEVLYGRGGARGLGRSRVGSRAGSLAAQRGPVDGDELAALL